MDFGFIITYLNRMKQEILDTVNSLEVSGGGGGNPSGGQVDIATTNYKTALMQQWITLTIGSGSAQLLNLLNAELETFNLSASTFLYGGYSTLPVVAASDNYWQLDSASGARLPGIITPANLKLSARFQGTNGSNYLGSEVPLYTGRLASQWVIGAGSGQPILSGLYQYSQFLGGTAASNAGVAANAFDGDGATSCAVGTQPCFVSYDLGAGNDKVLKYFYFRATNTNNGIWKIEGSNDNTNWTQLATNQSTSSDILITTTNTTSYRYYRVSSVSVVSGVVIEFEGFLASFVPTVTYDTGTFAIGSSSGNFNGGIYLPISSINTAETNIGNMDFQFRGFVNFSAISGTQTLFTLNNTLEIQGTTSGLRVRYSTNGSTFTNIDSSAISWSPNTWYFLSVRRTGNTLYFFVDGVAYGTADLTGISFYSNNVSPHGKVGCDTNMLNSFKGHLQELEFFVRTLDVDTAPASPRSTAFIPPVNLVSKANYIPSSAEKLDALFFLDETTWASFGVPIFGTDLTFQVSLNNGTTWNTLSMSKSSALSTLTNIYIGTLDLTGITNTNQLVYKIVNNSGKVLKWDGLILYWQ